MSSQIKYKNFNKNEGYGGRKLIILQEKKKIILKFNINIQMSSNVTSG